MTCMFASDGKFALHCCACMLGDEVSASTSPPLTGCLMSVWSIVGLLHRPTPTTDPLGIVAALNWQMSQGGGSEGNGFPVSAKRFLPDPLQMQRLS